MEGASSVAPSPDIPADTKMLREIRQIPQVVARQIGAEGDVYREAARLLKRESPRFVLSCARGSSDHAVTFFKYLIETRIGIPVASIGPSVASVYDAQLNLRDGVLLTVSQSGGSPDLQRLQARAEHGGARTFALVNVTDSPVGHDATHVLPMLAGEETAVAATKSFLGSLVALLVIAAHWSDDAELIEGLPSLPEALTKALECDWDAAALPVAAAPSLYTIGRAHGLGIAGEAALKLKETCRLHAEAYSAAEVRHGPIALARDRFAALVFANSDASDVSTVDAARALVDAGARVFIAGSYAEGAHSLPGVLVRHPLLHPLVHAASFYRFVEALSVRLGENPDAPPLLEKVTQTT